MKDVELANREILRGYPYTEGQILDPRFLKWSCLTPDNGRHFTETEVVTVAKLNQHCEMLKEQEEKLANAH